MRQRRKDKTYYFVLESIPCFLGSFLNNDKIGRFLTIKTGIEILVSIACFSIGNPNRKFISNDKKILKSRGIFALAQNTF